MGESIEICYNVCSETSHPMRPHPTLSYEERGLGYYDRKYFFSNHYHSRHYRKCRFCYAVVKTATCCCVYYCRTCCRAVVFEFVWEQYGIFSNIRAIWHCAFVVFGWFEFEFWLYSTSWQGSNHYHACSFFVCRDVGRDFDVVFEFWFYIGFIFICLSQFRQYNYSYKTFG